jgi:hypothetical protein
MALWVVKRRIRDAEEEGDCPVCAEPRFVGDASFELHDEDDCFDGPFCCRAHAERRLKAVNRRVAEIRRQEKADERRAS